MTLFTVDRIEGELAVLEVGGRLVEVPLDALPPGTHEGSVLRLEPGVRAEGAEALSFSEEGDEEQHRLAEAQARLARLQARSADLPDDIEL